MKTICYSLFFILLCMTSCSSGNDTEESDTPIDVDWSKATINESESNAYNSVFEVKFTQDNLDYTIKVKTSIYNYDKLTSGQTINESIESVTLINDNTEIPIIIEKGNIKVDNINADKLTLNFDNVVFATAVNSRAFNFKKFLINRIISYLRDKKSMEFTVDGKKAIIGDYLDIIISNSESTKHTTEFQATVNNDKFYTVCKKNTGQYLIKGYILNPIFEFIYTGQGDFLLKKGTIILYNINDKKNSAEIYYDNVTLDNGKKEIKINGIIKYKG